MANADQIYNQIVNARGLTQPYDLQRARELAQTIVQAGIQPSGQLFSGQQVDQMWDVDTAYRETFGGSRGVDPSGLNSYRGQPMAAVKADLVKSAEYTNKNSNTQLPNPPNVVPEYKPLPEYNPFEGQTPTFTGPTGRVELPTLPGYDFKEPTPFARPEPKLGTLPTLDFKEPAPFTGAQPSLKENYQEDPLLTKARAAAEEMLTGKLSEAEHQTLNKNFDVTWQRIAQQAAERGTPTGAVQGLQVRAGQELATQESLMGQQRKEQGIGAAQSLVAQTMQAKRAALDEALQRYGVESQQYATAYGQWKDARDASYQAAVNEAQFNRDSALATYGAESDAYKTAYAQWQDARNNLYQSTTTKYQADINKAQQDFQNQIMDRERQANEGKTKFDADMAVYSAEYGEWLNGYKLQMERAGIEEARVDKVIQGYQNNFTNSFNVAQANYDRRYKESLLQIEKDKMEFTKNQQDRKNIVDTVGGLVTTGVAVAGKLGAFGAPKKETTTQQAPGVELPTVETPAAPAPAIKAPAAPAAGTTSGRAPAFQYTPLPALDPVETYAPSSYAPSTNIYDMTKVTKPKVDSSGLPMLEAPGGFKVSFGGAPGGGR